MAHTEEKLTHLHFNRRRLIYAIIVTFLMLVVEIVGGIFSNSLALLSDAAHMFSHLLALIISYAAIAISLKPANTKKTYGYYRAEILAAFVNGLSLFIIVAAILYGAYERFRAPLDIRSGEMFIVAAAGLIVNILTALLLRTGSQKDINIKSAFLHALGDMISSVGVVAAAIAIYYTQLVVLDTIVSLFIAAIIIYWAFRLILDSAHILLEGIPKGIDIEQVKEMIEKIVGRPVLIHHIHTWQIGTNIYAMTAHASTDPIDQHEITKDLKVIKKALAKKFNIHHATIQFECKCCRDAEDTSEIVDENPCIENQK